MSHPKLALSPRQHEILRACSKVDQGLMSRESAAVALDVSLRTLDRLRKKIRMGGPEALLHGNAGVVPANAFCESEKTQIANILAGELYLGMGPTLACEYLDSLHGIQAAKETVRTIMADNGLWKPKSQKPRTVHPMRARRPRMGELVQADGTPHEWIRGRDPFCLIVLIDDATGSILAARFEPQECSQGYARAVESMVGRYGIPMALYTDKHAIFATTELAGQSGSEKPTRFARMLDELGIELILAHSPQAKGRVERANQTLQGRLPFALGLAGIETIEEANAFLPEYLASFNERFAVEPALPESALVGWEAASEDLALATSLKTSRKLSPNLSFVQCGQTYQVGKDAPALVGKRSLAGELVDLCEMNDGSVRLAYHGQSLPFETFEAKQPKLADGKQLGSVVDAAILAAKVKQRQAGRIQREAASQARQKEHRNRQAEAASRDIIAWPRRDKVA